MTVGQLLGSMGARELQEWQLFLKIEKEEQEERDRKQGVAERAEDQRKQAGGG